MISALVDGQTVIVGDWVGFKSDIEQSGKIVRIEGNTLTLQAGPNGFEGDYIGGDEFTKVSTRDCWLS